MSDKKQLDPQNNVYDCAVIGSGMAGMAASLYAANRGLSTVQFGDVGGILFSSGLLDLLCVHPISEQVIWSDPWAAIQQLRQDIPKHPYGLLTDEEIQSSFDEMLSFLAEAGLAYVCEKSRNLQVITSMGTLKHSYCVPASMHAGTQAFEKKAPCLLVDFKGFKEYSAAQIAATLADTWPNLQALRLTFPGTEHKTEVFTAHIARALESPQTCGQVAKLVKANLKGAVAVGFPAVLGIVKTASIVEQLTREIGVPVFEIPTMPTSVPGLRLKTLFDNHLPRKGITRLNPKRVERVVRTGDGTFSIDAPDYTSTHRVTARGIILATGRFMGKGLVSTRTTIKESIFDLPVTQPESRKDWHSADFFNPSGHPVNMAGLETDRALRPLGRSGKPAYENLFAAGTILAHQDWIRMKCGVGLALATAHRAVSELKKHVN